MKKVLTFAALASFLLLAGFVQAETFTLDNYAITANSTDPGLVIETSPVLAMPTTWDLAAGGSKNFSLFKIWTDETSVNKDDNVVKDISVAFSWAAPPGVSGGPVFGETTGKARWFGIEQWGEVTWDGPATFNFGNGGQFQIALSNATFNWGLFGLDEGPCHGATIDATLTYNSASVPEPCTLLLLGFGLIGSAAVRKSRFFR